ncbi:lipopolysaccharide biosynthesis protein [Gordonia polyisoprenivorans]|nr:lipopolysaccharide biosynthesis protein [Gordonia polyisoprenivorans]
MGSSLQSDNGTAGAAGALVTVAGQAARGLLQLGSVVVLARLLTPEQFGLVGMVAAFVGIASIFADFGLSLAAMQAKSLSPEESSTLFWVNCGVGLLSTVLVAAISPVLPMVFHSTVVTSIGLALSPMFLITAMSVQFRVVLMRAHRFGVAVLADVVAQAVGLLTAVVGALIGLGTWALVAQQLSLGVCTLGFLACVARWRPTAPWRFVSVRHFVAFSTSTVITQVLNYLSTSAPNIALGAFQSATSVGVFGRAFQLFVAPMQQFASPVTRVALVVLSRSAGSPRFATNVAKLLNLVTYLLGTMMVMVAACAAPIVGILLGQRWADVGPVLAVLAIGGVFQVVGYPLYWAILASGRTRVLLWCELPVRVAMLCGVVFAARWGVLAVSMAVAIGLFFITACTVIFGIESVGVSVGDFFVSIRRPLTVLSCLGLCAAATARFTQSWFSASDIVSIACSVAVGALTCFGFSLLNGFKEDFTFIIKTVFSGLGIRR